jgi:hypothetical protein
VARRALTKVCATSDVPATYRAFVAWRDQVPADMREKTNQAALGLQRTVFGGAGSWTRRDAEQLLSELDAIRTVRR